MRLKGRHRRKRRHIKSVCKTKTFVGMTLNLQCMIVTNDGQNCNTSVGTNISLSELESKASKYINTCDNTSRNVISVDQVL